MADLIQIGATARPGAQCPLAPARCPSPILGRCSIFLGHIKFGYMTTWMAAVLQPAVPQGNIITATASYIQKGWTSRPQDSGLHLTSHLQHLGQIISDFNLHLYPSTMKSQFLTPPSDFDMTNSAKKWLPSKPSTSKPKSTTQSSRITRSSTEPTPSSSKKN